MKIQYLNGGLANQVFQYIFVRFAEKFNPSEERWLIDDSFFFLNDVHNGYELEKVFGIHANLLSKSLDVDIWQEFLKNKAAGISIPQSLKNLGFHVEMIAESANYPDHNPFDGKIYRIPTNEFHPEVTKMPGDVVYYHGYWINNNWFDSYKDILKNELTFPAITDAQNLSYAEKITSSHSIGIHVRRGDYVTIGWSLQNDYYLKSMTSLTKQHPNGAFFVFSDDIEWCESNASSLGFHLTDNITFVDGNMNGENFRDLQLMSMCRGLLMSNSAFCFLAALLDERLEFYVQPPN